MIKSIINFMDKMLSWALILSTLAMIFAVVLQIVARYALPSPPHWTEEVARFCFAYMVSFGAGLALKDNAYVSVTTFISKFSLKARFYLEAIILSSIIILMLAMFIYSMPLLKIVNIYHSASIKAHMPFIYLSMPIMSFFLSAYGTLLLIEKVKKYQKEA